MKAKEGESVEIKIIFSHNLGDSVRPIAKWEKLPMGPCKVLFLQMQPDLVSHLKLVWYPVLIMTLLVLNSSYVEYVMDLLANVLNVLNEVVGLVRFELGMRQICLGSCKWYGHINGT